MKTETATIRTNVSDMNQANLLIDKLSSDTTLSNFRVVDMFGKIQVVYTRTTKSVCPYEVNYCM